MFYSPFRHGSQREATVRLLPHSVNTVTTLMTLNRGFLPTSDQHWIAALTPPQAPGFAVSSWWWTPIPSSSLYTLPFRSQVWDDGREVSSMPEGKGSRKRREVPGGGGENPLYIHTQTAWLAGWLAIHLELQVISSLPPPPPLLRTPPVLSAEEKTKPNKKPISKPNKRDCVGLQLDEPPD